MRKQWFGDARDYVKWSCVRAEAGNEFAVVYGPMLRPDGFSGKNLDPKVRAFFDELKDFQSIATMFPAGFDYLPDIYEIRNADQYLDALENRIVAAQEHSKVLVFLDPDTGVEPKRKPGNEHLRKADITRVCGRLRAGES